MNKPLNKRDFFSGSITEKKGVNSQAHQEFYCEGQSENASNVKEEQEYIIMKEKRIKCFHAHYNTFF
ncbi:MAG: hypothetical protein LBL07_17920 [Tannerella sp.]|nr:hypothetical protein [Tannerella sp.]